MELIRLLTANPRDPQYDTCHFCGQFLPIRRRDGRPVEYDRNGYPLNTPGNKDLVVGIYDGHKDDCPWVAARRFLGDPNAIKHQEPS